MLSRFTWFTRCKDRKLEWLLACFTLWFGVGVSLPPHSMASPSFEGALAMAAEWAWGLIYTLVGVAHVVFTSTDVAGEPPLRACLPCSSAARSSLP